MRCRSVDTVIDDLEYRPDSVKGFNHLQEVPGVVRNTVETGNHHGITNPGTGYQVVQLRPVAFCTGRLFLDDIDRSGRFELIELRLNVLAVNIWP